MIETILTSVFVFIVFFLALKAKKHLYVDEYTSSIQDEIHTFDKNFQALNNIEEPSDYQLGSGHIY